MMPLAQPRALDAVRPMRLALVCPRLPFSKTWELLFEPLGLVQLAHVARQAGHTVAIFDEAARGLHEIPRLVDAVARFEPDLIGFTGTTPEFPRACDIAAALRRRLPHVPNVFGGWHVSGDPSAVDDPAVDFVLRGEGEYVLLDLLDAVARGNGFDRVPSLSYKVDGRARRNPDGGRIGDLVALGIPSREGLDLGSYHWLGVADRPPRGQRFLTLMASRGCPYQCIFCQTPGVRGSKVVARTPENIVDELQFLIEEYGANLVTFTDEEFTVNVRRVEAICDEILARGIDLCWISTARADDITPDLARLMRRAGCRLVNIGVETGSDESLQLVKKRITMDKIRRGIADLVDADIQVLGTAIVGFPWEDEAHLDTCLGFFRSLSMDVLGLNYCMPFPGTALHEMAVTEDLIFDHDYRNWTTDKPVMRTRHLDAEALRGYYPKVQRAFYRGPQFWRRMARLVAPRPRRVFSIGQSVLSSALHGGLGTRFGIERARRTISQTSGALRRVEGLLHRGPAAERSTASQ